MKRIAFGLPALLLLGLGYLYFVYLRPVPPLQPSGQYRVATTAFDFSFNSRIDNAPRRLAIRAWYPAAGAAPDGALAPLTSARLGERIAEFYGMPAFLTKPRPSLSLADAPAAEGRFAVLVFNHGFGSFAEQNTANMQELASHGYVVLSIAHPGTSLLTEYADGSFVPHDPDLPAFAEQADPAAANAGATRVLRAARDRVAGAGDFDRYWQAMRDLARGPFFANMQPVLRAWAEDSNALIDAIAQGSEAQFPALLAGRLDGSRIGIFGHSLGGMTAALVALENDNISAMANLDGPLALDLPAEAIALPVPSCMLMGEGFGTGRDVVSLGDINTRLLEERARRGGCVAVFRGAWHMNFTDLNSLPVLRLMKVTGPVNPRRFAEEFNRLLVGFFDRHLKGVGTPYRPVHEDLVDYREF